MAYAHDVGMFPVDAVCYQLLLAATTNINSAVGFATEEEYEAFRIWHSMLFNSAKMTGNLCLSIHPLDYITMSENDEGWSSCMNWHDEGCYRRGTIEMMNSKYVLVAYVKSENNEIYMGNDNHWNSKKWRSLFYLDKDIITSIKGYPYQHPALVKVIIEKLEELAEANLGYMYGHKLRKSDGEDSYLMWDEEAVNYWYTDKYFHFVTNWYGMYYFILSNIISILYQI